MANGLPKIVDELNSIVKDVSKKIALYPQAERQIRRVLIELYIRIFDLFAKLMEWYGKNKHLFKILRKDCYNEFESDLKDIRTWAGMIRSEVQTNMALEIRQARDETRTYQQKSMQELQRTAAAAENFFGASANETMLQMAREQQHMFEAFENRLMSRFDHCFKTIGACQTGTLTSMAETMSPSPRSSPLQNDGASDLYMSQTQDQAVAVGEQSKSIPDAKAPHAAKDPSPPTSASLRTREEIEHYSRILDDWYPEGHMHPLAPSQGPGPSPQPVMYEAIAARISQWTRARQSQVLCIQLHYKTAKTPLGSNIASYVVSSAWEVHYPILSYFCTLPRTTAPNRTAQTTALCEMMASLVRQVVSMLPDPLPDTAASLDEARFQRLDGTLRTWEDMLGIFAQLLALVPGNLLIVLHGLQCLNSFDTTERIVELLDVIRERIDGQETSTTKLLFVNEGQSRAVLPWLRRGELSLQEGA